MNTQLVRRAAFALVSASVLATVGCGQTHAKVAYVNVEVLQSTWPKFINYQNQLQATLYAIQSSKIPPGEKQKQLQQLNQQSQRWQAEVTNDVKVGDTVVIAKGTAVTGEVVDPGEGKKLLVVKNKATFKWSSVESTGGTKLSIRGTAGKSDKSDRPIEQQGSKNKDVLAPAGTVYQSYIDSDQTVTVKK